MSKMIPSEKMNDNDHESFQYILKSTRLVASHIGGMVEEMEAELGEGLILNAMVAVMCHLTIKSGLESEELCKILTMNIENMKKSRDGEKVFGGVIDCRKEKES